MDKVDRSRRCDGCGKLLGADQGTTETFVVWTRSRPRSADGDPGADATLYTERTNVDVVLCDRCRQAQALRPQRYAEGRRAIRIVGGIVIWIGVALALDGVIGGDPSWERSGAILFISAMVAILGSELVDRVVGAAWRPPTGQDLAIKKRAGGPGGEYVVLSDAELRRSTQRPRPWRRGRR